MGETCAVRQSVGTTPVSKDLLKMRHSTGEMLCASSFIFFSKMAIRNQGKHYDSEAEFVSLEWTHYGRKGEDKRNVFSIEYFRTSDWYFTSRKSLCPTKKTKNKVNIFTAPECLCGILHLRSTVVCWMSTLYCWDRVSRNIYCMSRCRFNVLNMHLQ